MFYQHPDSLSPDPTYGRRSTKLTDNKVGQVLHPHALVRAVPASDATRRWGRQLNLFQQPPPLTLRPDAGGRIVLLVDFGTELDATLELNVTTAAAATLMIWQGESIAECDGFVLSLNPDVRTCHYLPKAGRHRLGSYHLRGYRFARLVFNDVRGPVTIQRILARAMFTFQHRDGDLLCSDRRFQQVWQSSVYTARLCTQSHSLWDGIKRDRAGWFGDARITKLAIDNVYFDPRPAEAMLATLPVNEWANTIPNYSFDGVCMLHQHILYYGLRPGVKDCFQRVKAMLAWAKKTQVDRHGLLTRARDDYYGGMGFLDYTPHPMGGRFEELCWLQCKYVEALRAAADVAGWLNDTRAAREWQADADRLSQRILKRFWKPGIGFLHTLNHAGPPDNPYGSGYTEHHQRTYVDKIRLGPSGPSRHSNALAIFARLATPAMKATILQKVFRSRTLPPINTAYFSYYEKMAWAECGDPAGALLGLRDYLNHMLETEDSPTLWEWYDPNVRDLRKYGNGCSITNTWATSLCHGWGAGLVPIATRHLLGITPTSPGYRTVSLKPHCPLPLAFQATVPTPAGPIKVERNAPHEPIHYSIPAGIRVDKI